MCWCFLSLNRMERFVLLILCILCCSCRNNDRYKSIFEKEILFPSEMYFTVNIKDTVSVDYEKRYKVVAYIDSTQCFSCKMKQGMSDFVKELNALTNDSVPFMIFIHPKTLKEMKLVVERDDIIYPICIDLKDVFRRINSLSSEEQLRYFVIG